MGMLPSEVDRLKREEWAVTADDVLSRRCKRGLHLVPTAWIALPEYLGA